MKARDLALLLMLVPGLVAAASLRLGDVLGDGSGSGFARAAEVRPFRFPDDHGPHPEYRSEWWYLTASLESADGREFGVQYTLFRQALAARQVLGGPWDASQVYLAHLAVTDVAAGRHVEDERLARAHPRLAGVNPAPFRAWLDGWTMTAGGPGLENLHLQGTGEGFAVDLRLEPLKNIVLQGDRGLSAKGPGQASYYYSLPRLDVAGEIRLAGERMAVTGRGWLDREWSTSVLSGAQAGWDWFALHLDGGADLMVYQLRRRDGLRDPYDRGVWVKADGRSMALRGQDFTLTPVAHWRDERKVAWPVAWKLSVLGPDGPRQLEVRAALDDQRMDTLLTYWEGLVRVFDEAGRRIGSGYMELTGYD